MAHYSQCYKKCRHDQFKKTIRADFSLNGEEIAWLTGYKCLTVYLDSKLNWS